ncbi:unnamed protein product, partial [Effrenium voratum]
VDELQTQANVIMTVTQVVEEASAGIPNENAQRDKLIFNNRVLEFSLIKEVVGVVEVMNVSDLTEPILIRFSGTNPIEGDSCVHFDFVSNTWSSEGVSLVNSSVSGESTGTWCETTHTSIFAIVQTVPFELRNDLEADNLNANSYVVAAAFVGMLLCVASCCVCFLLGRRLRPPAAGKTEIQDDKGNRHVVTFSRSNVTAETKIVDDEDNEEATEAQKVLVKWDVEPERFMTRLDQLRGHRWITMDLGANAGTEAKVTKEASESLARRSLKKVTLRMEDSSPSEAHETLQAARSLEFGPAETMMVPDDRGVDGDESPPAQHVQEYPSEGQISDMIEVCLDVEATAWQEVHQEGSQVYYWSSTHQMLLQGYIKGDGKFLTEDPDEVPHYDVQIGARRQLRRMVPCRELRPTFQGGETILVYLTELAGWCGAQRAALRHAPPGHDLQRRCHPSHHPRERRA